MTGSMKRYPSETAHDPNVCMNFRSLTENLLFRGMDRYRYYFFLTHFISVSVTLSNCSLWNLKYQEEDYVCHENRIEVKNLEIPRLLSKAIKDIITAIPASSITLAYDNGTDAKLLKCSTELLQGAGISTRVYQIDTDEQQEKFLSYIRDALISYKESSNLIISENEVSETILSKIHEYNLINRNILYIFLWRQPPVSARFIDALLEAMKVAVIINSRPGTPLDLSERYRIYYSQAKPSGKKELTFVNWWSHPKGLFQLPLLPHAVNIYDNFAGRLFYIPVLHKPPWNYVNYENGTIRTNGGRDDQLLKLLALKLNFRYEYTDPPERILGSGIGDNGTYRGVLGLIWQREAPFVLGDVTITYERMKLVDFSSPTLADCGAFITHSPRLLNEALALLRPFHWQVWIPVVGTALLFGPALFIIMEAPRYWRGGKLQTNLFYDCVWFSVGIFLKQSVQLPSRTYKVRLITILLSIVVTYVIGGLYSATLTSLLAKPAREQPIRTLEELEFAMREKGYQLLVERHSSSLSILQNGTGIYDRMWKMMTEDNLVDSVEEGMNYIQETYSRQALLGGWETLYFDSRRFGAHNFHLANCLFTRYSAIAMQTGSPYRENFDRIIIRLSQAGILSKMTEDEYERIGEKINKVQNSETDGGIEKNIEKNGGGENIEGKNVELLYDKSDEKSERKKNSERSEGASGVSEKERRTLKPVSVKMVQGAFFVLIIGFVISGIVFSGELLTACHKQQKSKRLK